MIMKKRIFTAILIGAMLNSGILIGRAFAANGMGHGEMIGQTMEDRQEMMEMDHEKRLEIMDNLLELSDTQQEQVRTIYEQERATMEPYWQKMREVHEALRKQLDSDTFDEAEIRTLAASQADLETEMMVSHARVRHQIFALLNPDQQALAKKLQPLLRNSGRHHPAMRGD